MALQASVWRTVKNLYCEQECSTRKIAEILGNQGFKISQSCIAIKAKKEGWIKGKKEPKEGEVVTSQKTEEDVLVENRARISNTLTSLNSIVVKTLKLKEDLIDRTQKNLDLGHIDEIHASKIISNLGLGILNIAKMLGISPEENLNKANQEKDVTQSQIQIYLPNNGRK